MNPLEKMQPVLILPIGEMSTDDIAKLNANGICTVEAKNPSQVKFCDPIPSAAQRGKVEQAAIELSRKILTGRVGNKSYPLGYGDLTALYVECLIDGTPLQNGPTLEERERQYFTEEKMAEIRRLAREEAKTERLALKLTVKPLK